MRATGCEPIVGTQGLVAGCRRPALEQLDATAGLASPGPPATPQRPSLSSPDPELSAVSTSRSSIKEPSGEVGVPRSAWTRPIDLRVLAYQNDVGAGATFTSKACS